MSQLIVLSDVIFMFQQKCAPALHNKYARSTLFSILNLVIDFNTRELSKSSAFQSIVTDEKSNKLYTGGRYVVVDLLLCLERKDTLDDT